MTDLKRLRHLLPVLCAMLPASALAQNPFVQKDTAKAFALLDSHRAVTAEQAVSTGSVWATGAFKTRIVVPGSEKHFLNDITSGSDGTVYVTDTHAGRVWLEPIKMYLAVKISSASSSPADTVRVDGSPALAPLARALAEAYRAVRPSSVVTVGGGLGSRERIDAVRHGRIDIALASQVIASELATQGLAVHEIAKSAVVFAVNAGVPVTSLTSRQICDAYRGDVKNWRELGGSDLPLAARTRPPAEVDAAIVLAGIECFRAASAASTVARVIDRPEEMATELASVPGALGMTSMPFVEQSGSRIKALALDGIRPDAERVRRGAYPLTRSSFLVTSASPSGAVARFIAFVRSDAGARIIRANGAVPLP